MKNLSPLYRQLTQFGLNPTQWVLQSQGNGRYRILSLADLNTYFIGETTMIAGQTSWTSIELAI